MTRGDAGPSPIEVELAPGVTAVVTTAAANLAPHVGDDPPAARRARTALARALGVPVAFASQVHGADVHSLGPGPLPEADVVAVADAMVTTRDDVALGVLVADCVPVLLADPAARVVGVVHAGRRGIVAGVVGRAVEAMTRLGAGPDAMHALVGPAACGACYEVPAPLRDEVAAAVPRAASTTSWGTPALDLPVAVVGELHDHGVRAVRDMAACTVEDATWFSHRGATGGSRPAGAPTHRGQGRIAGVVRLLPACRAGGPASSG